MTPTQPPSSADQSGENSSQEDFPTSPGLFDAPAGQQTEEEPLIPSHKNKSHSPYVFDLVFLRWSLVVDGALTTVAAFATKSWHIYLGELLGSL